MKKKTSLITGILFCIVSAAMAQDAPIMALDPTLMAGWSGNLAYGNTFGPKSSVKAKSSFPYTSTPAMRQSVVASFTKRLQSQSPQGANAVMTTFGPGKADYGTVYAEMLKTSALHDNDAADALAGLILAGYQIVNNVPDAKVTKDKERAARMQIAGILANNSKLNAASTRARTAEELKLQTVILALGLQESLKNNTADTYRKNIADMFLKSYRLNLYQFQLTTKGFSKKKS
ncbi:hypothetical protein ACFQZI_06850 [Mucilaginibacter lutimaris]|uniref:Uncharacterized protein n=1 Tax=Mucilaginibacter lutimaris TaxID=931629 RepID=A0ABW2ZED2_9SPHI